MISITTLQTTTPEFQNASSSITNGFGNTMGLGPLVLVVLYAAVFIAIVGVVAPVAAKHRVIQQFSTQTKLFADYVVRGIATSIVIGGTFAPLWFVSQLDSGTRSSVLLAGGVVLVGLGGLAGLGYVSTWVVGRFVDAHPDGDSINEIFGWGTEDEIPE